MRLKYALCVLTLAACTDDPPAKTDTDVTDTAAPGDTDDTAAPGDTDDTAAPGDTDDTAAPGDTDDTAAPGDTDDTAAPGDTADTSPSGPVEATPGIRCAPADTIGLVVVEEMGAVYASAYVYDRTNPVYGPPAASTAICDFYRFDGFGACADCAPEETCGRSGRCETLPLMRKDVVLELIADGTQRFESNPEYGDLWGEVTLGRTTALKLSFADVVLTLPPTTVPDALQGVEGTLDGDYETPKSLSIRWTPVAGDTHVFTHVPMNHHVSEPTFTQCLTPASAGALEIGGDMLQPLARVTGLEFQGIEHARFAAAQTPHGCVEIRYQVKSFVPL